MLEVREATHTVTAPAVALREITKVFPGVVANDRVSLELRAGEVHALLGENGAGKTSLMNVLYGLYQPDGGDILIDGQRVRVASPRHAMTLGIGLVAQHPLLVARHSVAENVALGLPTGFMRPGQQVEARLRELGRAYGLAVDPRAKVWQLSAGERQRVEILKALMRGARVLILDEPTSVLTPQEALDLLTVLERMKAEGHAVVVITHKLDEVMRAADRVTVLRRGAVVGSFAVGETSVAGLARLMVGRDLPDLDPGRPAQPDGALPALEVVGLSVAGDRGPLAVRDVSFSLSPGEVLGVAGVAGNGQRELVEALTGLRPVARGTVRVAGRDLAGTSAATFAAAGVAHVPEDRLHSGVVPGMSVAENLVLRDHGKAPYSRRGILDAAAADRHARAAIEAHDIRAPGPHTPARLLSGGNIQKLILARELAGSKALVVAAHPTYGLDAGATFAVRERLLEKRAAGAAVLLVSEDLEEVLALSDRVAVLFDGRLLGPMPRADASAERLGLLMAGREVA